MNLATLRTVIVGVLCGGMTLGVGGDDATSAPSRHPTITEVLYHVPTGAAGDANQDGARDSSGDEFIELVNLTGKPIQMKGYRLSSRLSTFDAESRYGIRFIFPEFELPPNGVVVVFNGYKASLKGAGTSEKPPEASSKAFADAWVFSMETTAQNVALKNEGDFVLLTSPDGDRLDVVSWGKSDPEPPSDAAAHEHIGSIRPGGSVQRVDAKSPWRANKDFDGQPFSPGVIPNR